MCVNGVTHGEHRPLSVDSAVLLSSAEFYLSAHCFNFPAFILVRAHFSSASFSAAAAVFDERALKKENEKTPLYSTPNRRQATLVKIDIYSISITFNQSFAAYNHERAIIVKLRI